MNKTLLSLVLCLHFFNLKAQTKTEQAIVVGTLSGVIDKVYISSALGEAFITTLSHDNYTLTQGFLQRKTLLINNLTSDLTENVKVNVYPNPTTGLVNVVFQKLSADRKYRVRIFNANGAQINVPVKTDIFSGYENNVLDFTGLSNGQYFVQVIPLSGLQGAMSFKVVKIY